MTDDVKFKEQAQDRLKTLAIKLAMRVGPVEATNLLVGAGIALAETALGREATARYLRELAAEIEADDTGEFPATQGRA